MGDVATGRVDALRIRIVNEVRDPDPLRTSHLSYGRTLSESDQAPTQVSALIYLLVASTNVPLRAVRRVRYLGFAA